MALTVIKGVLPKTKKKKKGHNKKFITLTHPAGTIKNSN